MLIIKLLFFKNCLILLNFLRDMFFDENGGRYFLFGFILFLRLRARVRLRLVFNVIFFIFLSGMIDRCLYETISNFFRFSFIQFTDSIDLLN